MNGDTVTGQRKWGKKVIQSLYGLTATRAMAILAAVEFELEFPPDVECLVVPPASIRRGQHSDSTP